MHKLNLLVFVLLSFGGKTLLGQNDCCTLSLEHRNAMLASNTGFVQAHMEPIAFTLTDPIGKMIDMTTNDGVPASAYFIPSKTKSNKYIVVFHEWWGLNDHIKKEAEHIYSTFKQVNVIAVDLYDGKIGTTRETASKLMVEADEKRIANIINAAFNYAGKDAMVATYGWCLGGGYSLKTAINHAAQVKACVMYYGMPELTIEKLKLLQCDVLGVFGTYDKFIDTALVKQFATKMQEANKQLTIYNYAADHAFANPSNPGFNETASKDAFNKATKYIRKRLRIKLKK